MAQKGETLSADTIRKINEKKISNFRSKCDWNNLSPWEGRSFGKRSVKCSLSDFEEHITSGRGVSELIKIGVHSDLINFYSSIAHGKIPDIDESEFRRLYYEEGLPLKEVGKNINVQPRFMPFLMSAYNMKRSGSMFQARKRTEIEPDQRQIDIICGSLMGDAKKTSPNSVGFGHGDSQKQYAFWKFYELNNICPKGSFKSWHYTDSRSGFEGTSWRFYTKANSWITDIVSCFYPDQGKRDVSQCCLDRLSPLSIAVWYMDDGRTDWHNFNPKTSIVKNASVDMSFCTESFSKEGCQLICDWLLDKHIVHSHLRRMVLKDSIGYRVVIDARSRESFINMIEPHIIPSMMYKIDYQSYLFWRKSKECLGK